jgi:diguanylate cyclase (GGDEF)-like protein
MALRASIDELTQLPNRSALLSRLAEELERYRRHEQPVSLLFIDVDHFKSINDRFGHSGGDDVLRAVGETLHRTVRFIDYVGRYGGEEFLVIAPSTSIADAVILAERLRKSVEGMSVPFGDNASASLTISLGIAEYPGSAKSLAELIEAADVAMYHSKREGRNRATVAEPPLG